VDSTRRRGRVVWLAALLILFLAAAGLIAHRISTCGSPADSPSAVMGPASTDLDPGYWTEERMRNARPAPMPTASIFGC
jgi:hypothetical protein